MLPEVGARRPVSILMVVDLPAPLGAEEAEELALSYGEIDIVDGREGAEAAGEGGGLDGGSLRLAERHGSGDRIAGQGSGLSRLGTRPQALPFRHRRWGRNVGEAGEALPDSGGAGEATLGAEVQDEVGAGAVAEGAEEAYGVGARDEDGAAVGGDEGLGEVPELGGEGEGLGELVSEGESLTVLARGGPGLRLFAR